MIDREQRGAGWGWILVGLFGFGALAALSKESGIMLPLYALLIEWLVFRGALPGSATRKQLIGLYVLALALPGIAGLAWLSPGIVSGTAYLERPFTLSERLWTEARVLWSYLGWIIAPRPAALSLYHDAYPLSQAP